MLCDLWPHPAYSYYINSLKVEVSQSHPVMKAFCGLLLDMMVEGGRVGQKIRDAEEGRDPEPQTHSQNRSSHTCNPSVWCLALPWQPAPPWFQGFRRIGRVRLPAVGGSVLAGSCCTLWSTTRLCWAPGSTSRHWRPPRASWMGPPTAAPRKAATRRPARQLLSQSSPLRPQQTKIKLTEIPDLCVVDGSVLETKFYLKRSIIGDLFACVNMSNVILFRVYCHSHWRDARFVHGVDDGTKKH